MSQNKSSGGTYIAPSHLIRKEREVLDKNGNVIKREVQEPSKDKKHESVLRK
jgi:hypothetical protein